MEKELREMLQRRKQEMLELDKAGFKFDEFEPYLPEAETDPELAFFFLSRDLILELKQLRREKGLNQADIAEKMGTKQAAVSRFENYGNTPSLEFAFKYAWALGVKLSITTRGEYTLTLPKELWEPVVVMALCTGTTVQQVMTKAIEKHIPENFNNPFYTMLSASYQPPNTIWVEPTTGAAAWM